jgi:hypothetical protein
MRRLPKLFYRPAALQRLAQQISIGKRRMTFFIAQNKL